MADFFLAGSRRILRNGQVGDDHVMAFNDNEGFPPVEPIAAGLKGCCPRCGKGKLFSGFLTVAPRCENCGLDFSFADAADGPAIFVMLIIGFVVVGLALWVGGLLVTAALAALRALDSAVRSCSACRRCGWSRAS